MRRRLATRRTTSPSEAYQGCSGSVPASRTAATLPDEFPALLPGISPNAPPTVSLATPSGTSEVTSAETLSEASSKACPRSISEANERRILPIPPATRSSRVSREARPVRASLRARLHCAILSRHNSTMAEKCGNRRSAASGSTPRSRSTPRKTPSRRKGRSRRDSPPIQMGEGTSSARGK